LDGLHRDQPLVFVIELDERENPHSI
jgi:hypothetical protein